MKCPLCLNVLKPAAKLLRFCPVHPEKTAQISVSDEHYADVFCPGTDSNGCSALAIDQSPILLHIGCPFHNPFETKTGFSIPAVRYEPFIEDDRDHEIESWQLALPRLLQGRTRQPEMWFPLALFLATNVPQQGSQCATVLILGEQNAGKSVLATMAIRDDTWRTREMSSYGYVFVSPKSGVVFTTGTDPDKVRASDYIQHLAATVRVDGKLLDNTEARDLNLRALFLSSSTEHVATVSAAENAANASRAKKPKFLDIVRQIIPKSEEDAPQSAPEARRPPPKEPRNQSVVLFYDVAGEQARRSVDEQILRLSGHMGGTVVVLDVLQLSCFAEPASTVKSKDKEPLKGLATALAKLKRLEVEQKPHCLVITRLDLLRGDTGSPDESLTAKPKVAQLMASGRHPKFAAFRQQLESPRQYQPMADTSEREILLELFRNSEHVEDEAFTNYLNGASDCPVFFVWTEGLGKGKGDPYSVGVERFVKTWCLRSKQATKV